MIDIDIPKLTLTRSKPECVKALKKAGVDYKRVNANADCIVFVGRLWGFDFDMRIALHFENMKLQLVELLRPEGYYRSNSHEQSFNEIQSALVAKLGEPDVKAVRDNEYCDGGFFDKFYCYDWHTKDFSVRHCTYERFVLSEGLSITLNE